MEHFPTVKCMRYEYAYTCITRIVEVCVVKSREKLGIDLPELLV